MTKHLKNIVLLSDINVPDDLRKLKPSKLPQVAEELRNYIIDSVSKYGGHFASSLGVVELTIALHYCYNTPVDKLVWDVGHQAYGHKIITGRKDLFHTNRTQGGLAGFPRMKESPYDAFGVGHSSTSISAILGMAIAAKHQHIERHHIAVIGDGAITGGMAFEAMNHAGISEADLLIVLNDNSMSIDPNTGALKDYLISISTSKAYNKIRTDISNTLSKMSKIGRKAKDLAYLLESTLKSVISEQSNFFQSFNLKYFGPVDGHDVNHLVEVFEDLKNISGPKILHVRTIKGKGFSMAEKNQTLWHAPGLFDKKTGKIHQGNSAKKTPPKYQDVFGYTLVELAKKNEKIVAVTPAMISGSGLKIMENELPDRLYDVDIAEQHAVTFSAGMATQGMRPFCNIYSTFMQRGYDQVIHDVCLQKLPVIFCLDRAGLVGADGATHHGAFDIAYMRCLPQMIVASPMNEMELRNMMYTAQLEEINQPFTIRYPRGWGTTADWENKFEKIIIGKGRKIISGEKIAILSLGPLGNVALEAVQEIKEKGVNLGLYDMRFVKPLDHHLLDEISEQYAHLVTVEDGCLMGGFGSAILEYLSQTKKMIPVTRLGIPDRFIEHGTQNQLYQEVGYDKASIISTCLTILDKI